MMRLLRNNDSASDGLPLRIIIGTCPGNKKDAELQGRMQAYRHFDIPDNAWIYLHSESGVGTHYEIQEGGDGRAYLPALLRQEREPDSTIVLRPLNGRAVEVVTRRNRTLQTVVLPESRSQGVAATEGVQRSARMRPVVSTGGEWLRMGVMAFSLGLLTLTTAGVINKAFSLATGGFYEAVEIIPAARLAQLSSNPADLISPSAPLSLPLEQWGHLTSAATRPGEYVSRLYYEDGNWQIEQAVLSTEVERSFDEDQE